MSERGSLCTEYIYCSDCVKAIKQVFDEENCGKYLHIVQIPSWEGQGKLLPIFAGKIGGLYNGEEIESFDYNLREQISDVICHPVRFCVFAENPHGGYEYVGEKIFNILPKESQ